MADDTDKHIMRLSGMDVKRNMGNAKPMPIYGEEVLGKIGHYFITTTKII